MASALRAIAAGVRCTVERIADAESRGLRANAIRRAGATGVDELRGLCRIEVLWAEVTEGRHRAADTGPTLWAITVTGDAVASATVVARNIAETIDTVRIGVVGTVTEFALALTRGGIAAAHKVVGSLDAGGIADLEESDLKEVGEANIATEHGELHGRLRVGNILIGESEGESRRVDDRHGTLRGESRRTNRGSLDHPSVETEVEPASRNGDNHRRRRSSHRIRRDGGERRLNARAGTDDLRGNNNVGERIAKEASVVGQVDDVLPVSDRSREQTIERIVGDVEESQTNVRTG